MNVNWNVVRRFFGFGREQLSDAQEEMFLRSRRGFLRQVGAVGVAVAVPSTLWLPGREALSTAEMGLLNQALFDHCFTAINPQSKAALDAINVFTRLKVREEGFFRRVLPMAPIGNCELQVGVDPAGKDGSFSALVVVSKVQAASPDGFPSETPLRYNQQEQPQAARGSYDMEVCYEKAFRIAPPGVSGDYERVWCDPRLGEPFPG